MPNSLCHFELMTRDPARSKAFYGAVFDWRFDDSSLPGYTLINAGAEPGGGLMKTPDESLAPCLNVYFNVEDIDATIVKATQKGARVLVPHTTIPNVGSFAILTDPDGIPFGVFKPKQ